MKFRGDKKRHIKFLYSSFKPEQLNKLFNELNGSTNFYMASFFDPTPREKDKNSRGQKASYQFFLFSCRS
ncbi:hypothetical protein BN424_1265 [Carnobacterium maltaromaticum LMA28]|uniref:Uncharacterized protein n=1 Tax=Carnobacterium maltaromaticum LMA28 TaxID=1234679 RepID=K8E3I2_CARML|nr:hypothetical protein BN424_1265 [Carnobacterium maltaromaticum LMA28]